MNNERPTTTLFMLMSVDGKISTGSTDERDIDKDFPKIDGISQGLRSDFITVFKPRRSNFGSAARREESEYLEYLTDEQHCRRPKVPVWATKDSYETTSNQYYELEQKTDLYSFNNYGGKKWKRF